MSLFQNIAGNLMKPTLEFMSRGRLPQVDGRIYAQGLEKPVTVRRDRWGIPHLHATNRHDLIFAQGFVHAQDRLWQMELNRRVANGRLAEILGEGALETDRVTRTLGFARGAAESWAALGQPIRGYLEAYAAGVNAFLDNDPKLPVEFSLLRHQPESWTPLDSLAFVKTTAWALSLGWAGELTRAQLVEKLGPDLFAELEPHYADRNPVTLPQGIEFNLFGPDGFLGAASGPFINRVSEGSGQGSNGWVISAERSGTGHAILCNDMHLSVTSPSVWYYLHMRSADGYHVAGVSQPGAPFIVVGHNEHLAWGATLSFADCEDLFIEKLDPADPTRYEFQGEWRAAQVHEERIRIKGGGEHIERVVETHHGPIISSVLPTNGQALAMSSTAFRPTRLADGFRLINEARNWDEFVAGVKLVDSPSLNIVYADVEDNIGYYVTGRVPVRARGNGLVPVPGWSGEYEWTGDIPFEEMPHALNPEQGYLISCNNRIARDEYPHYLGELFMNGYRARRLESLITAQERVSLEDCRRFHFDFHSIPGLELVERLADLETADPDAAESLTLLREWDGWLGPESIGGTVYEVFLGRLTKAILETNLSPELMVKFLGQGPDPVLYATSEFYGHWVLTMMRILDNPETAWLPAQVGREAVLVRCLAETTQTLRELLGESSQSWHWGRLHQVRFLHAMAVQPPLDMVFNQGPAPIGGDTDTVAQTAIAPGDPYENNIFSISYRQIIDLGNLANSAAMYVPGQSGHLASPHYGNMIEPWLTGGYFAMIWDEAAVAQATHHTLTLAPPIEPKKFE